MTMDWLESGRRQFYRLSARMPHAMLVHGERGMGKYVLAMEMVASLLCDQSRQDQELRPACGQCRNCLMFASDNHPDLHLITSELRYEEGQLPHAEYALRYLEASEKRGKRKPRKVIAVDQIRKLIENFSLSNHSAAYKVALIDAAEAMNINASNALLKLLEEPSPGSVLILLCNDISRLPMTIRSRCINLAPDPASHEQAMDWLVTQGVTESNAGKALAICGGAPLVALQHTRTEDIVHFESLLDALVSLLENRAGAIDAREKVLGLQSPSVLLGWLQRVVNWLISSVRSDAVKGPFPWQAYQRAFSPLSRRLDESKLPALFKLYDDLLEVKSQDVDVVHFGLLLDKWLIAFEQRLR